MLLIHKTKKKRKYYYYTLIVMFLLFTGVALQDSKKYSQTAERPVRISMAALDPFASHGKLGI